MRKLWEDHVTWTRLAIISLTTDSPDTEASVGRLLQNQTDIGNAIKPYYGAAAGKQLTAAPAGAHPDRRRPDRRGRRPATRRHRRRAGPLDGERRRDRGVPRERQPALLEARRDEGDDAPAPTPDDERGRRPTQGDWAADVAPTTRSTSRSWTWRTCSRPASSSSFRRASARFRLAATVPERPCRSGADPSRQLMTGCEP